MRHAVPLFLRQLAASLISLGLVAQEQGPPRPTVRLVYDLPAYELSRTLAAEAGATLDQAMADAVAIVRRRLAAVDKSAKVERLRGTTFTIEATDGDSNLAAVRSSVEALGSLEMRVIAEGAFRDGDVHFDLEKERQRLEAWLRSGGRELVLKNWQDIERFNDDAVAGPLARPWLRWCPHLVKPDLVKNKTWGHTFTQDTRPSEGITPMGPSTVAVFDRATEWNNGTVPESMAKQSNPFLLEFVAINMKEHSFSGADLDPGSVKVVAENGRQAVQYRLKPQLCAVYGDWSEKYLRKHSAILVNGCVRAAPYFLSRINGLGQISGSFTPAEIESLATVLRAGDLATTPKLLRIEPVAPR